MTTETSRLHLVKKVQRSFVVEYKSGRRKTDPKSHSIWGNTDLKSVVRDVQDEAMPFLTRGEQDGASDSEVSLPKVKPTEPLLTPSIPHPTTATATQETIMADENDTTTNNDAPASVVAEIDTPKKQRKPRAKKAAPEMASVDVAAEPAADVSTTAGKRGKQTRGRKPKSSEDANSVKSAPVKRAPKAVQAAPAAPIATIDEMADLLQLEKENQRLRKLLTEKLRAENADLRKRLNLG
jgi:hypothetical protein